MNIQEKTEENKTYRKIYVACLSSYNSGILHGKWIILLDDQLIWDINIDDYIQKEIDKMLKSSKMPDAEEWAIHDYNNFPNLGEYPSIENIIKVREAQKEHGINQINAFLNGHSVEDLEHFEDSYSGEYDSFRDYAVELFDELYLHDVPEHIQSYIDYDKFENDCSIDTTAEEAPNNKVYIFRQF